MHAHRSRQEELERLGRALRTQTGSNRALLRIDSEPALLQEICRVVVEDAGYRAAMISRAEHDEHKTVTPLVKVGPRRAFDELRGLTWADTEQGHSATGTAIRTGAPCIVNDVRERGFGEAWRDLARRQGFGSLLSLPLRVEGEIYGALTIMAPEPDSFDDLEIAPLLETAGDLMFGLETLRARARAAAAESTIRRMTYFDPVSGLANKIRLRELLSEAIAAAKDQRRSLALLRIELERYREIGDVLGYKEADRLVRAVAERLQAMPEHAGTVTHIADAEFAIVVPGAGAEQARQLAQRILDILAESVEIAGLLLDARSTIGISLFPGHGTDVDTLMRRSSIALSHARRSSSGLSFFRGGLDVECAQRIALMADLRRAIERNELRLFCQPKLQMNPRQMCGAEALVRWNHPSLGLLNPSEFIKLAENSGLITPLTYWMLDAVLRQSYEWREQGLAHPISVNLSARDLRDPRLLDRIGGALATWGADSGWIDFELTESALMEDPAGSLLTLSNLKRLGVSLTIDDFGTGYSSLSYLRRLPVDAIKIDQSFVLDMLTNKESATIVRSTIELAHNLDLEVVAEGVEDTRTFDELAALGCDMAQGYCICRPIPAGDFANWVDSPAAH